MYIEFHTSFLIAALCFVLFFVNKPFFCVIVHSFFVF